MSASIGDRIRDRVEGDWHLLAGDGYRLLIDVDEGDEPTLAESVERTLRDEPRWLHFRWLYDAEGSRIYERITEQPEYYLTRTEAAILDRHADDLRDLAGDLTLVELGSGSSRKTRYILDAWRRKGATRYVPIDISRSAIESACRALARAYPGLEIEGLAARYGRAMPLVRGVSPLLLLFLGSSVGNFNEEELDEFLELVSSSLAPGDKFLLGIDLVKDEEVLIAAYNDAAGWTRRFMINVIARLNRELGTDIPLQAVAYDGLYDFRRQRIEMHLRFIEDVAIDAPGFGSPVRIRAGESVLVEISRKFTVAGMTAKLQEYGFHPQECFSDPDGYFAVLLLTRGG